MPAPSLARSFGSFIGGELSCWSNDDKRTPLEQLRDKDAVRIDTHMHYALLDGCRGHRVEPFSAGDRYSLVFFSLNAWERGPKEQMPQGSVYPTVESLKYYSDLLAPARGQGNGSILALFGKQVKPQALFWPRASLIRLPSKSMLLLADYAGGKKALPTVSAVFSKIYQRKQ